MQEPIKLQLAPTPVEPTPVLETTPAQNIAEAYLGLEPLQKIMNYLENPQIKSIEILKAFQSNNFLEALEEAEADPQSEALFAEDLKELYAAFNPEYPTTFKKLQDNLSDPNNHMDSLDYLNQKLAPLVTIEDIIQEFPDKAKHLTILLRHQQKVFARFLVRLRSQAETEKKAAAA